VIVPVIILWLCAYLLGSIPFGLIIAKAKAGVDITKLGSGNIGATNVQRTLGWKAALPVLLLDISKGLIPASIAHLLNLRLGSLSETDVSLIAGFAAVLGHCASPFLRFRGGKGVATICGAAIGSTPPVAGIGILVFLFITAVTRYISLASILAVLAATATAFVLPYDPLIRIAYILISLFIIYKHRSNLQRLAAGQESKFNFRGSNKRKDSDDDEGAKK